MNPHVLIASKSKLNTRLLSISCKKYNIETLSFNDKKNLLQELAKSTPDILFLDESIVDINNRTIISEIKGIKDLEESFIIFTANSNDLSNIALKIGADAFLPIPFSKMKFESAIRNLMNMPKRILIVSKNKKKVHDLNDALEKMKYELFFSDSGDECMRMAHKVFPDLILTDYYLFDMTGTTLCKKIKNANLSSQISVFILFNGNSSEIIEECFEVGAQDVLLYPLDAAENIDRITTVVTPPTRGRKERALVIDDSHMIRGLITKMFKQLGFIVTSAENGFEGLKAARKVKPDIITCDYDMPVMNGWDFCMEAKQDKQIDSPIIMVSARGAEIDKKKGRVLGVVEYLTKPFKGQDLKTAVAKAIAANKKEKNARRYQNILQVMFLQM